MLIKENSSTDGSARRSEIHRQEYDGFYYVKLYDGANHVRTEVLKDKSIHYAEDLAENWILGILN